MHEQDFEALLREVLPLAQENLAEKGEFTPMGGIIKPDGTTEIYTGDSEDENMPAEDDGVLELLFNEFRSMAEAGELRAVAVCFNAEVALTDEEPVPEEEIRDAIYICLEHETGTAIDVFMPYERTPGGEYGYAELEASDAHNRVFAPTGDDGSDQDDENGATDN